MNYKAIYVVVALLTIKDTFGASFMRTIEAVGYPFYKIIFSLGECKERILHKENKIWGSVKLNRVFDIYYNTGSAEETISRVEIALVINNTDSISHSNSGVGQSVFDAILILPSNVGIMFYTLTIYSCSRLSVDESKDDN